MDILIIRHGQSEADILNVIEGRADFPLTELGLQQANLMAEWVKSYMQLDKIFASPLKRAAQTAEKLSSATGIPITFDENLMEWRNGLIAGLSREEAARRYPEPSQKFPHTALYEMESNIEFRARAETALSKIINENPSDSKIAIVSHGGLIARLFQSFLGLPVVTDVGINNGDTGIHHLQISNGGPFLRRVVFANSLVHLR